MGIPLKIAKIVGKVLLGFLGLIVIFWIVLSILSPFGIPEGNSVDYMKGVWMPDPREHFSAYFNMERLREDGVNTISLGPLAYNKLLATIHRPFISAIVKKAHKNGMAVHIAPNSWGPGFSHEDPHIEMEDLLTEQAIYWAEFAEQYNVEYFSPQNEHDVVLGCGFGAKWAQDILDDIREVYSGEIILKIGSVYCEADPDYQIEIKSLGDENSFWPGKFSDATGYDYFMIDILPFSDDVDRDLFLEDLENILGYARQEVERKELKGFMIGEFGYLTEKPAMVASIMPGPELTEEEQAQGIEDYLEVAMPMVDGIVYCGWTLDGYGFKDKLAEDVIKEKFSSY